MTESKYGKYIVTDLAQRFDAEFDARYAQWATRILWMDNKVVDGAFQMNCSWYLRPPATPMPSGDAHTHDSDEMIGFLGAIHKTPMIWGER